MNTQEWRWLHSCDKQPAVCTRFKFKSSGYWTLEPHLTLYTPSSMLKQ